MLLGTVDPVDAALLIAAGATAGVAASGPLTRALAGAGGASTELSEIYVRPGKGSFGVGLITIRPVPAGTPIIQDCAPKFTKVVQQRDLLSLPKEVRLTVHELFDCLDDPAGTVAVPTEYEQAIPLISFINHSTRPNCEYDPEYHAIYSLRDLRAGEEATVNYFEYQTEESFTYRSAKAGFKSEAIEREVYEALQ